jgi:hypothetical protein
VLPPILAVSMRVDILHLRLRNNGIKIGFFSYNPHKGYSSTHVEPLLCVVVFQFCFSAVLDNMGASMEVAKYTERLVPSTRFVSVDGIAPTLPGANNFIAPSASIIGNVTLGEHSRYETCASAVLIHLETVNLYSCLQLVLLVTIALPFVCPQCLVRSYCPRRC